MARLHLSPRAEADVANILAVSLELWGEAAMERYSALLSAAMRRVATDPDGPTTKARTDLLPGMRSLHIRHARSRGQGVKSPVHVLYYRVTRSGAIEIVRVLHERMDPHVYLGG